MDELQARAAAADSPAHLRAIGLITVHFAMLEGALEIAIGVLLETDQKTTRTITCDLFFSKKIDLLRALVEAKVKDPSKLNEARTLLGQILKASKERNDITHSVWGVARDENMQRVTVWTLPLRGGTVPKFEEMLPADKLIRLKATAKGAKGFRSDRVPMSADELYKIADDIAKVAYKVLMFFPEAVGSDRD